MVRDGDVNMVEDVVVIRTGVVSGDDTGVLRVSFLINVTTHRKASAAVVLSVLHWVTPSHRHVVHNPVVLVVHKHSLAQQSNLLLIFSIVFLVILGTEYLAVGVLQELDLIGGRSNSLSEHHLSQVLGRGVILVCFTEVETKILKRMVLQFSDINLLMVLVRDDRLLRVEPVDEEFDVIAAGVNFPFVTVGDGSQAREIEAGDGVEITERQDETCQHPTSHLCFKL